MQRGLLALRAEENPEVLHALSAPVRVQILSLLECKGPLNINEMVNALNLPQSSVATGVQILEKAGLVESKGAKGRKGQQKICSIVYDKIVISFEDEDALCRDDVIEVRMPVGLYTRCKVSAPCGLCSQDGVIGLLDVPDFFLDPGRMQAGLIWFGRGFVEYKFPNNAKMLNKQVEAISFSMELSSEVPGTNPDWPSDITLWVNDKALGTWTSPGDYGDQRGTYTPGWWKLEGSQYGKFKTWRISQEGTQIDSLEVSDIGLADLDLFSHSSIKLRIGIADDAIHPGGVNIFGRGFGNYNSDIVMRLHIMGDS